MPSPPTAGSTRLTPSTSTAATTTPRSDANSTPPVSTITSSNAAGNPAITDPKTITLGLRWIVEETNSWLSNYGQLRRNTDRKSCHRDAALCLATTVLIVGKLLAWRDRWDPR